MRFECELADAGPSRLGARARFGSSTASTTPIASFPGRGRRCPPAASDRRFQAPTGTQDVLAPESARVETARRAFRHSGAPRSATASWCRRCSRTPGSSAAASATPPRSSRRRCTSSTTRAAGSSRLRPEGTASVVRAFVQHHPVSPLKAWYVTPVFRYERPQAGRFRQHHQLGRRDARHRRPDRRRRGDLVAGRTYLDLGLTCAPPSCQLDGRRDVRSGLSREPGRVSCAARGRALSRAPQPSGP